jgi:hypothetical protein
MLLRSCLRLEMQRYAVQGALDDAAGVACVSLLLMQPGPHVAVVNKHMSTWPRGCGAKAVWCA